MARTSPRRCNVPDAPHIDCRRVLTKLKKQLGRPVPTRHDQTRVIPRGHAVAISGLWGWLFELACQTKIRYLQISTVVDQKIGGWKGVSLSKRAPGPFTQLPFMSRCRI